MNLKSLIREELAQTALELALIAGAVIVIAIIVGQALKIATAKAAEGAQTVHEAGINQ